MEVNGSQCHFLKNIRAELNLFTSREGGKIRVGRERSFVELLRERNGACYYGNCVKQRWLSRIFIVGKTPCKFSLPFYTYLCSLN